MLVNGRTAMEGLSGRASGRAASIGGFVSIPGDELAPYAHAPDPHWLGDILQYLRTHIVIIDIDLAPNLPMSIV